MENKLKRIVVKVTFITECLGMRPQDPDIVKKYIASNAPNPVSMKEEIVLAEGGIDEVVENTMTVFPKTEDGRRFFFNYQWKGYFKETCSFIQRFKLGPESAKVKAFKKTIDGNIQIQSDDGIDSRLIFINIPVGEKIGSVQRSLRAQTAQGDRIALANSESIPKGSTCKFLVTCPKELEGAIIEWLDYGQKHGTGQWRNADYGLFTYEAWDYDTRKLISKSSDREIIDLSNF